MCFASFGETVKCGHKLAKHQFGLRREIDKLANLSGWLRAMNLEIVRIRALIDVFKS